jgi:quercetin dioxygenase-like cupin family protein
MTATVFGPGEGRRLTARGSEMVFKAVSDSTKGAFSFMERELPPGGRRPPRHVHLGADEAFYVLAGEITFSLDDETVVEGAGSFVLAPGGVMHSFGNEGTEPARVLILHAPAMDAYFQELHDLWSDPDTVPTRETEMELMRHHGMQPSSETPGDKPADKPGDNKGRGETPTPRHS